MSSLKICIKNEDNTYGPTSNGYFYVSSPKHRKNAKKTDKNSKWIIKENQEFEVFRISREASWYCNQNSCLFSLINDCSMVLGDSGERLVKFPKPSNATDPWHGYPVKCNTTQNTPSDILLDKLEKKNIISKITKKRIEKGKI